MKWAISKIKYLQILLWAVILAVFVFSFIQTGTAQKELSRSRTEEALRRGAVAIYAAEGRYPATCEELCEELGIRVDDAFRVEYDIFGENVLPSIQVVLK